MNRSIVFRPNIRVNNLLDSDSFDASFSPELEEELVGSYRTGPASTLDSSESHRPRAGITASAISGWLVC